MACSGKPAGLIKKTNGLLINDNATESLAWLKNVKADIIEISSKIVLTLLINSGQPSKNSIPPSYLLNMVRRL